jgi:hypothetical protein
MEMPDEIYIDTDMSDNRYSLKNKEHRTKYIREKLSPPVEVTLGKFDAEWHKSKHTDVYDFIMHHYPNGVKVTK